MAVAEITAEGRLAGDEALRGAFSRRMARLKDEVRRRAGEEARQKRQRHVVDRLVAEVFEHMQSNRFPGAGQSAYDDQARAV